MSRIGKQPITLPSGVTLTVAERHVQVAGTKGQIVIQLPHGISVAQNEDQIQVSRKGESKNVRAAHGLVRSLINAAIEGVVNGYKKTLKLVGTGYRVQAKGNGISLALGFSHSVEFTPPAGIIIKVEGQDLIHIEGFDKQVVGQVAANIRKLRPPEAYKGKGIRYLDEVVKTKPGKAATATAK